MPEWAVIITLVGMIFSAGMTWGILSARSKNQEKTQHSTIEELKTAVGELKGLVIGWKLLEASDLRNTQAIAELEKTVQELRFDVAMLKSVKH